MQVLHSTKVILGENSIIKEQIYKKDVSWNIEKFIQTENYVKIKTQPVSGNRKMFASKNHFHQNNHLNSLKHLFRVFPFYLYEMIRWSWGTSAHRKLLLHPVPFYSIISSSPTERAQHPLFQNIHLFFFF